MRQERIAITLATFLLALVPNLHASRCSNATGAGRWEFTVTGTVILPTGAPIPVAQVGTYTQDKWGNLVGSQTRSLGGSVAEEAFTGTVSTNPDCTAKATIAVTDNASGAVVRTSTLEVVFIEDGRQARSLVTTLVLPSGASLGPVLTIEHRRLFVAF